MARTKRTPTTTPSACIFFSAPRATKGTTSSKGKRTNEGGSLETPPLSEEQVLKRALDTLKFATNDPYAPPWLTGLAKPLPHPDLTALQDSEVETRFWVDEIARLQALHAKLPPKGSGEWRYEHFGSTIETKERKDGVRREVLARGVWRLFVGGQMVRQLLDKFPMTLEGEPLGWATAEDLSEYLVIDEVEEDEEEVDGATDGLGIKKKEIKEE